MCESGNPDDGNWRVYQHEETFDGSRQVYQPEETFDGNNGIWTANTSYVREIVELFCSEIPPAGWVLLEDNCATTGKKSMQKMLRFMIVNTLQITKTKIIIHHRMNVRF